MQDGGYSITALDARRPNDGAVVLMFGGSPERLLEWTIRDAQGTMTRTQLTRVTAAPNLAASLFQLRDPTQRPRRN